MSKGKKYRLSSRTEQAQKLVLIGELAVDHQSAFTYMDVTDPGDFGVRFEYAGGIVISVPVKVINLKNPTVFNDAVLLAVGAYENNLARVAQEGGILTDDERAFLGEDFLNKARVR